MNKLTIKKIRVQNGSDRKLDNQLTWIPWQKVVQKLRLNNEISNIPLILKQALIKNEH